MIERFKPMHDFIVVKIEEKDQKTASGIFIPNTNTSDYTVARVISVGTGKTTDGKRFALQVKAGDLVLLGKFKALEIEDHIILKEEHILGVLDEQD